MYATRRIRVQAYLAGLRYPLTTLYGNTVDPWFNFRATKYLVQNGFYSFWDWFDDRMRSPSLTTGIPSIMSFELPH